MTKYHSMFGEGCTSSATAAIRVLTVTSPEVKSSPARREIMSETYPSASTPRMAPMISELLIRVFISAGYPDFPSRWVKMTLVGLASWFWNPSLKLAMYYHTRIRMLLHCIE